MDVIFAFVCVNIKTDGDQLIMVFNTDVF
jgi:hypothetical protein